ncbi:cartilage matrix protein-like [Hoplias malabaricus]|uniref:cartilage matrix protein-like n=1 Tax=Hoplias malabaricus TaxID=27720 RepID=UPI0034625E5E
MTWTRLFLFFCLYFFPSFAQDVCEEEKLHLKTCNKELQEKNQYITNVENNFFAVKKELRQVRTLGKNNIPESIEQIAALQKQLDDLVQKLNESLQTECDAVDVVFLFDGSASMRTSDFEISKKFIWNVVTRNKYSSTQFAAVQFSRDIRTVFTFKDYMESTAKEKLSKEEHMQALTNTYMAIRYVLANLFNNVTSWADPKAKKVLVIITDGVPSDYDINDVIKQCDDQGILRVIIGVGNRDEAKLGKLASEPKEENVFYIMGHDKLDGLLNKLQNKICCERHAARKELSHAILSSTEQIAALKKQLDDLVPKLNKTECEAVDVVFLFDGSSSMKTSDFELNKMFIWNVVMKNKYSSTQFAAVQFSGNVRTVFSFKDYMESTAKEKLGKEEHMQDLTNTYKAITYVLDVLFNNTMSGADPAAKKVLIIFTDGVPSDYSTSDVLKQCDDQGILRITIGIGNVDINKIQELASKPKEENAFYIRLYNELDSLLDKLQNAISSSFPGVC